MEELEINFRLDGQGRTADTRNQPSESVTTVQPLQLDYSSKTCQTKFVLGPPSEDLPSSSFSEASLDDMLLDCEIADSGLMPRTFWVPMDGNFRPRFSLERLAYDVFCHHVGQIRRASEAEAVKTFDPQTSGAEWWVQIRPSPECGRYRMHDTDDNRNPAVPDMTNEGISFHWDKDEELRIMCGGNTYVHPHISTVTYLTSLGAPTLALNCRVHPFSGDLVRPDDSNSDGTTPKSDRDGEKLGDNILEGFLSWPKAGKHMSFDGRYLHAAPADLMRPGEFAEQVLAYKKKPTADDTSSDCPKSIKNLKRKHRRVTFLVNIWLNFHPLEVKPFPETMLDKMSGSKPGENMVHLEFQSNDHDDDHCVTLAADTSKTAKQEKMCSWPMGDCGSNEWIDVHIPMAEVNNAASTRGNVRMVWDAANRDKVSFRKEREIARNDEGGSKRRKVGGDEDKP